MSRAALFRHDDGVWPNTAALAFTLLGWPAGIALLGQPAWWLNAIGVALVVLTLTWSAYFIHEFAHQAIFRTPQANERWGTLMSWINGSCFARFADLRRKHMRHHVERADVITFDAQAFLRAHPLVRRAVLTLATLSEIASIHVLWTDIPDPLKESASNTVLTSPGPRCAAGRSGRRWRAAPARSAGSSRPR